ncbi:hypothetical protein, partial [Klebsiella pneumoniae]|uniref:hypothetical protein n=1 Tax=Klebsiella pneumoniae TaxID=573 RepID=UPI00356AD6E0
LNLTLPIKQDSDTLKRLQEVKAAFATQIQPKTDKALRESKIVHFARVLVIQDKNLPVLTEYDGDSTKYTEFFRRECPDVFSVLFSLTEWAPDFKALDQNSFFELSKQLDIPSLRQSTGESKGYLFSAYNGRTVGQILSKL